MPLVSIAIASHNMRHLLNDAIGSCLAQTYEQIEIVVLDDASTDGTDTISSLSRAKYYRSNELSGTGGAFNKAIACCNGDIIVLLCADDVFTNRDVIADIVKEFDEDVVHVSRYYHQFIDGDRRPVRAWRDKDIMELGNNPSGLAFRTSAIKDLGLSNLMFVEAATLVADVIKRGRYKIIPYDTVAVRIHKSTSRNKGYYLKRWNGSPVLAWYNLGGKKLATDYTSLIQIKNYFVTSAVIKEGVEFLRIRPMNALSPAFWFFFIGSVVTPRFILLKLPELYRSTIGRWTTKEVKRPDDY